MLRSRSKGFTLIELMIVVAIVAILASLAYASYSRYAFRTRRSDGKNWLTLVAAAEERYYTNFNKYTNSLAALNFSGTSEKGYYLVSIDKGASGDITSSYQLTATPQGAQSTDACGNLLLYNDNTKQFSGSATNGACW